MNYQGISTSKGIAFGTVFLLKKVKPDVSFKLCDDVEMALEDRQQYLLILLME